MSGEFVIGGLDCFGGTLLQEHHPGRTGGLVENRAHEQGGPPLRLTKARHEDGGESDQSRPGLSGRHALREFAAGGATARADEAVPLIFGDDRLDLGKFPDLMAKRLGIDAGERFAAAAALARNDRDDSGTLFGGDQRTVVFVVSRLTAAFAFRLDLGRRRLVVRMRGRGGLRRIGGRLALKLG